MHRFFIVILILSFLQLGFGQKSSLIKNVNYRAKDLKHDLNKNGDTLMLQSDKTIYQVDIYNSFYEKKIAINRYKSNIAINDLPEGKFVIEVVLSDRRIIMTLIKHETAEEALMLSDARLEEFRIPEIETKAPSKDVATIADPVAISEPYKPSSIEEVQKTNESQEVQNVTSIKTSDRAVDVNSSERDDNVREYNYSPASLLNTRLKKPNEKSNKYYWVVLEISNGNSSSKTKKLVRGDLINGLISQNKAEIKTAIGRNNKLTIWEVYDTKKFMKEQLLNRNFVTSETSSKCFNPIPYYTTSKSLTSR